MRTHPPCLLLPPLPCETHLMTHRTAGRRHIGAGGGGGTAVDVDYGGVSFDITQIDGVLDV
jgi:hypothetical protein